MVNILYVELNKISNMIYQISYIGYNSTYKIYTIKDILFSISDIHINI